MQMMRIWLPVAIVLFSIAGCGSQDVSSLVGNWQSDGETFEFRPDQTWSFSNEKRVFLETGTKTAQGLVRWSKRDEIELVVPRFDIPFLAFLAPLQRWKCGITVNNDILNLSGGLGDCPFERSFWKRDRWSPRPEAAAVVEKWGLLGTWAPNCNGGFGLRMRVYREGGLIKINPDYGPVEIILSAVEENGALKVFARRLGGNRFRVIESTYIKTGPGELRMMQSRQLPGGEEVGDTFIVDGVSRKPGNSRIPAQPMKACSS